MPPRKDSQSKAGRKTKLTPELQKKIALLVAAGAPIPLAVAYVGMSWNTVKEWFTPEYADRPPYSDFVDAMEQAKASHAIGAAMRITKAGKKGAWQADLAILERRHAEFWRPVPPKPAELPDMLAGMTPGQILDLALGGKKDAPA